MGPDALRYFLISSTQIGEDYQVSDKGVEEIFRKVIDKFKNVFNFYNLYANKLNSIFYILNSKNILDQWILARLNEVVQK